MQPLKSVVGLYLLRWKDAHAILLNEKAYNRTACTVCFHLHKLNMDPCLCICMENNLKDRHQIYL